LEGEDNNWHTTALAGTRVHVEGVEPHWNEKNRKEQQYVVEYLRSQLRSTGVKAREEGPYPAYAGGLVHLKSDFYFTLPDTGKIGDVLQMIHPTPAVCGLPKMEAYRFILANEDHDRRYYSGFIGEIDPAGKTLLYVNLRCMEVMPEQLVFYAGGGLLPSSTLEEEWQETEDKLTVMKAVSSSLCASIPTPAEAAEKTSGGLIYRR
jgi:isochorismate synthase